jgi:hypothetical protein
VTAEVVRHERRSCDAEQLVNRLLPFQTIGPWMWEGGTPTQKAISRLDALEIMPEFARCVARGSALATTKGTAVLAHGYK